MLAPLKNRSILEVAAEPDEDKHMLRQALRRARQAHKRSATLSARKQVELTNRLLLAEERNRLLQARLAELESGAAITTLAQQLIALRHENDELIDAARRVWFLDRTLCAAHRECERLAKERDCALSQLRQTALASND